MIETLNTLADRWLDWQLAMLWQTTLLIAIVWLIDLAIRRWAWPQVRYALWLLVLVKLLIPPTLTSPASLTSHVPGVAQKVVSIQPGPATQPRPVEQANTPETDGSPAAQPNDGEHQPPTVPFAGNTATPARLDEAGGSALAQPTDGGPLANAAASAEWHGQAPLEREAAPDNASEITSPAQPQPGGSALAQPTDGESQPSPAPPATRLSWQAWLLLGWLAGIGVLLAWLVVRFRSLRNEHLKQNAALPAHFHAQLRAAAERIGVRRLPRVTLTDKVRCPAVFGVFRPVLLIPADKLGDMTEQETEHVLLHELAHIHRGDLYVHAVYLLLQIAYWFNPLLWLIRRPLQNLRELCCDATVARLLREDTVHYRRTLLETARRLLAEPTDPGLGLLGLFENSSWLLARLQWLEKKTWRHRRLRLAVTAALVVLMAVCILPMAQGEPEFDLAVHGITIRSGSEEQPDYAGGSDVMRAYMQALMAEDEQTLARLTVDADPAACALRLTFNEIDKLRFFTKDSNYSPSLRRTIAVESNGQEIRLGLFSGGRIKRIDGLDYILLALVTQEDEGPWQLRSVDWYSSDTEFAEASRLMDRAMAGAIGGLLESARPAGAESIDVREIEAKLSRVSEATREALLNMPNAYDGPTLHGHKVTPAKEDVIPVIAGFIDALKAGDFEAKALRCPPALEPRLRAVAGQADLADLRLEEIRAGNSFAIVLAEGIRRHDGRPDQLGFTFAVYPGGQWVFMDTDWLTAATRDEFVDGFEKNYPGVEPVYPTPEETGSGAVSFIIDRQTSNTPPLEFRILPEAAEWGTSPLTAEEEKAYRQQLIDQGPNADALGEKDYLWLPLRAGTAAGQAIVEIYQSQSYVLASNQPGEVLSADGSWGLDHVYKDTDPQGNPIPLMQFDSKGAELFYELTRTHVKQPLAIVLDGQVMAAPQIMMPIRSHAVISGTFTNREVDQMIRVLGKMKKAQPLHSGPLTFDEEVEINRAAQAVFRQTHYRRDNGWAQDESERRIEPATLALNTIEFDRSLFRHRLSADLKVACPSWPRAEWQVTVRLLDARRRPLATDRQTVTAGGEIRSGQVRHAAGDLSFDFGPIRDARAFEIEVAPAGEWLAADDEIGNTVFLLPEHFESQTVLSLKTGRFIPLRQAREVREPYLAYNYTFPPGQRPSQYTVANIPEDCIGVETANLHLGGGGFAPDSVIRADLWSIERPEQLPEFNDPRRDSSIELFIGSPTGASWPFVSAFRADDGTAGVFEILGVQDRRVHIRYKVVNRPEEPAPANPAFTAALSDGSTVELLGVADIPAGADAWWAPDGTPLAPVYWEDPGHPHRDVEARQAVLRLSHNEPDPDRAPKMSVSVNQAPPSAPLPAGSYAGSFIVSQGRRTLEDHAGSSFSLHGDAPTVDIVVTVSYGPWQTITMRKARADNELISHLTKIGTMILNDPTEQDGKTVITATLLGRVDAWRFVAVDREGKIHSNGSAFSTSMKDDPANGFAEHQLCRAEFNVPLDQIQEFRFQTRNTQAVTFQNVALRAGLGTHVQIKTESSDSEPEKKVSGTVSLNADSPFTAALPGGLGVELLGVYDFSDPSRCWSPQGRPLDAMLPFHQQEGRYACKPGQAGYEFLIRIDGLEEGADIGTRMTTLPNPGIYSAHSQPAVPGMDTLNLRMLWMVLDKALTRCDLEVEIACDEWTAAAAAKPGSRSLIMDNVEGFEPMVTISPLAESSGRTVVSLSHQIIDRQVRVIAVDTDGKTHVHPYMDDGPGTFSRSFKDGISTTYLFDLPLSRLDSIQLQTRPYHKVTFQNVALRPGPETDVSVETASSAPPTTRLAGEQADDDSKWVSIDAPFVGGSGRYRYPSEGLTLKALLESAGLKRENTDRAFVEVSRKISQGSETAYRLFSRRLSTLLGGKESDLPLEPGDVVTGGYAGPAAGESARRFGEPIEMTINDDGNESGMFADLDSATLPMPPVSLNAQTENTVIEWTRQASIDVMGESSIPGLVSLNLHRALRVDGFLWDADPQEVADRLCVTDSSGRWFLLDAEENPPATYLIQTSEHRMGVLQILAVTRNPDAVKIRYKLLEPRPDEPAAVAPGSFGPVDFDGYFPDSADGAKALEALWNDRDKDLKPADEILETVHGGLRRYRGNGNILRWIGNLFIWGKDPQHPGAIELMVHASGSPDRNLYGDAVYFGLSVTQDKTPEILRALAAVAMKTDDYTNVTGRILWGCRGRENDLIAALAPWLASEDAAVRQKAEDVRSFFTDPDAFRAHLAEQHEQAVRSQYAGRLDEFRRVLLDGGSQARLAALTEIQGNGVMTLMDDAFVDAFAACMKDPDSTVRTLAARMAGGHYVWSAETQNPRVIEALAALLDDPDREARGAAVYYGLSTVREYDRPLVAGLLATILDDREVNYYGRVIWGLRRVAPLCIDVLREWMEQDEQNPARAVKAYEIYEDVTDQPLPEEYASHFAGRRSDAHEGLVAMALSPQPVAKDPLQQQILTTLTETGLVGKVLDLYVIESRQTAVALFTTATLADRNAVRDALAGRAGLRVLGYTHGSIGPTGSGWLDSLGRFRRQHAPDRVSLPAAIGTEAQPMKPDPFTAALSEDVSVELLGIGRHSEPDPQWWTPDGKILHETDWKAPQASLQPDSDQDVYLFIFKAQRKEWKALFFETEPMSRVSCHVDAGEDEHGAFVEDRYTFQAVLPKQREQIDLHVKILTAGGSQSPSPHWAVFKNLSLRPGQSTDVRIETSAPSPAKQPRGAWQTVCDSYEVNPDIPTQGSTLATDYGTVAFGNTYEKGGATFIDVTDSIDREVYEVRIVAVGPGNEEIPQNGGGSNRFESTTQTTARFDVPLKDVQRFRILARPHPRENNASPTVRDDRHFVGSYITDEMARLPKVEWSHLIIEIEYRDGQYFAGGVDQDKDPMEITAAGLEFEEPGEHFTFTFDPASRTYRMVVTDPADGTLLKTWPLVKLTGPNSGPGESNGGTGQTGAIHTVTAEPLTDLERRFVEQVLELVGEVERDYPEQATHWPAGPALYHVNRKGEITVWSYQKLWPRDYCAAGEVGWGDSRLESAEGMYYLPDGTPLQSRWSHRSGGSMHDIRVQVNRSVAEGEKVAVIHRRRLPADRELFSADGGEKTITLESWKDRPMAVLVRVDKPLRLSSWNMGDLECTTRDLEDHDLLYANKPPDLNPAALMVTVRLPEIQGRVYGPDGEPLENVTLQIRQKRRPDMDSIATPDVQTDADGYYAYVGIDWPYRVGALWSTANADGTEQRSLYTRQNKYYEGRQTLDFRFKEPFPTGPCAIRGRVIDQDGNPLPDYVVRFANPVDWTDESAESIDQYVLKKTILNPQGEYELDHLPAGEHEISIYSPERFDGYTWPDPQTVRLTPNAAQQVDFVVTGKDAAARVMEITGRVTEAGRPLPGCRVIATVYAADGDKPHQPVFSLETLTGGSGQYHLQGDVAAGDLPAGKLTVAVMSRIGNLNIAQKTVSITPGRKLEINFGDEEGHPVSGAVLLDDAPVQLAQVFLKQHPDASLIKWGWTDAAGMFRISAVPAGRYTAYVHYHSGLDPNTFTFGEGDSYLCDFQNVIVTDPLTAEIRIASDQAYPGNAVMQLQSGSQLRVLRPGRRSGIPIEPMSSPAIAEQEIRQIEARLRMLATACAVYRIDHGRLPAKLEDLLNPDLPHGPYVKNITDADLMPIAYCLGSEFAGTPFPESTPLMFSRRPDPATGRYPVAFLDGHIEQWSAAKLAQQNLLNAPMIESDALRQQLETPIEAGELKAGAPLTEAIDFIRNRFDPPLPIVVDWDGLKTAGILPTDRATNRGLVKGPAGEVLRNVLFSVSTDPNRPADYFFADNTIRIAVNPYNFIERSHPVDPALLTTASGRTMSPDDFLYWVTDQIHENVSIDHPWPYHLGKRITLSGTEVTYVQTEAVHNRIAEYLPTLEPMEDRVVDYTAHAFLADEAGCRTIASELSISLPEPTGTLLTAAKDSPELQRYLAGDFSDFRPPAETGTILTESQARRINELLGRSGQAQQVLNIESRIPNGRTPEVFAYTLEQPQECVGIQFAPPYDLPLNESVTLLIHPGIAPAGDTVDLRLRLRLADTLDAADARSPVWQIADLQAQSAVPDGQTLLVCGPRLTRPGQPPRQLILLVNPTITSSIFSRKEVFDSAVKQYNERQNQ